MEKCCGEVYLSVYVDLLQVGRRDVDTGVRGLLVGGDDVTRRIDGRVRR